MSGSELAAQRKADAFLNVRHFGARGDGTTDDTAAFKKALNTAITFDTPCSDGNTILVPAGDYVISDTLEVRDVRGLQIIGAGVGSTTLRWKNVRGRFWAEVDRETGRTKPSGSPRGGTLFALKGVRDSLFQGFSVVNDSNRMGTVFAVTSASGSVCQSVGNTWEQIDINGGAAGVRRGFRFRVEGDAETLENSFHVLRSVDVRGYLDAAFSLEHTAVRGIEFYSCHFEGGNRGMTGLASNRGYMEGNQNHGGSFRWHGGGGGNNVSADFELGDVTDTILISGGNFRGSARFLHTGGPSGNQWPVIVQSNVWLDDGLGEQPNSPWVAPENYRIVNFQFRGPLVMTGNQFGVPPDPIHGPQVAKPAEIIWNPGNNFGQFLFEGNYVATTKENPFKGSTATGSSIGIYPTSQRGNIIEPEDFGNSMVIPLDTHVTRLSGSATPTVGWLHTNRRLFKSATGNPITNLIHGDVGQEIVILGTEGGRWINSTPNIDLAGEDNLWLDDGFTITLAMFDEGVWTEISRKTD